MARSSTFSKREIEKNKRAKKLAKQKRREERKNEPTDSFKDMIAYVDAYGVITDEKPEEVEVEEIELEDIEISIPKSEVEEHKGNPTGHVEYYNINRGYGFIKEDDSVNKYFFHQSNAEYGIGESSKVTFELERGPRGMNAIEVKLIK